MIRTATTALAVAGALLVVACGTDGNTVPSREEMVGMTGQPQDEPPRASGATLGADIHLSEAGPEWTIWAAINAADDKGISVDSVRTGDSITIESIAGVAYFDGQSGWSKFLSGVRRFAGGALGAVDQGPIAKGIVAVLAEEDRPEINQPNEDASMPRDGFGRNLTNGNYATGEGGIVICTPKATGPMYAHDKNHLSNSQGRTESYLKNESEMKSGDCFFAMRGGEAVELRGNGVLYIYAFDRDYRDNSGVYEVKFRIKRGQQSAGGTHSN